MRSGKVGKLICTGIALAALGALAGCSGGSAAAKTGLSEQPTITVDSVPAAEEGGLYVAEDSGFFAQQGRTVKINSVTGGESGIPDLQSGKAELVDGNYVSFILAQMAGKFAGQPIDMRIIAASSELQPGSEALYVMPHSKYQTIADLAKAHARIGLNTRDDAGEVMLGALYKDAGYSFAAQPQVTPPAGFQALITMLAAGQVDAAWLPQPLGETAEQQIGAVPLADFDQGSLQDFPFTGSSGRGSGCSLTPTRSPHSCGR